MSLSSCVKIEDMEDNCSASTPSPLLLSPSITKTLGQFFPYPSSASFVKDDNDSDVSSSDLLENTGTRTYRAYNKKGICTSRPAQFQVTVQSATAPCNLYETDLSIQSIGDYNIDYYTPYTSSSNGYYYTFRGGSGYIQVVSYYRLNPGYIYEIVGTPTVKNQVSIKAVISGKTYIAEPGATLYITDPGTNTKMNLKVCSVNFREDFTQKLFKFSFNIPYEL